MGSSRSAYDNELDKEAAEKRRDIYRGEIQEVKNLLNNFLETPSEYKETIDKMLNLLAYVQEQAIGDRYLHDRLTSLVEEFQKLRYNKPIKIK